MGAIINSIGVGCRGALFDTPALGGGVHWWCVPEGPPACQPRIHILSAAAVARKSSTKGHKGEREKRILKNPDIQFNPTSVNSIMEAPEWSIKPRQIYDAQKIQTVERTRIWVREVIRKSKQKNTRIGIQNKIIIPVFSMIVAHMYGIR